jgi:hypothetical protein
MFFMGLIEKVWKIDRVSPQIELAGLDVPELGGLAYPPDAEPSLQPAAAGIASSISVLAAWQQPQLDSVNLQPLPQSLRVRPSQQNQVGRVGPNYQEKPVNPNYQERPANPNYQERLVNPNYQEGGCTNASQLGGNAQSDAWSQNQRNRPRRITLDSDKQSGNP